MIKNKTEDEINKTDTCKCKTMVTVKGKQSRVDLAWHHVNAVNNLCVITHNGVIMANKMKIEHGEREHLVNIRFSHYQQQIALPLVS